MTLSKAVILAAGRGTRLRPITDFVPKPLLPLANRSALSRAADKLEAAGVTSLFINTHHLAEQVEREAAAVEGVSVRVVREARIRGTGGGIENFRADLLNHEFILYNCDVYSEQDLLELIAFHRQRQPLVTLMGVDFPLINTLVVKDERLTGIALEPSDLTYSGIAVVSPRIWRYMPSEECFAFTDVLLSARKSGEEVAVFRSEAYWNDFGSPGQYLSLHRHLAEIGFLQIDSTAKIENTFKQGFNFIGEGCRVLNCILEDSIILPGTVVEGRLFKKAIIGRGFQVEDSQRDE